MQIAPQFKVLGEQADIHMDFTKTFQKSITFRFTWIYDIFF